ncbi:transglutaminase-like domain-containing protein [Bernardetia sp.]|uniref:transglutaminase-like domain-containing protein n=1 Tax=Bernardetia sp. TaxID=1937974 RepID=UPI0025BA4FB4|nr:transglutaminase-like domain-containing protein [Bernardetia sp.]
MKKDNSLSENELKALISLLEDDDTEILNHIRNKILSIGKPIIPLLEDTWTSSLNLKLQSRIEDILHTLQFGLLKEKLQNWYENEQDDLLKGLWILATYQYPDLEYEELKVKIEQLYFETWVSFQNVQHPIDQIRRLNSIFFEKLSFKANVNNFHSVNNSMINQVLESKKGNPISLSVVYMLIAQKLKLPVFGVNLPNLFVLTYKSEELTFYINVFNRGVIFAKQDIDNYLKQLKLPQNETFYSPCDNLAILRRTIHNLIQSFEHAAQGEKIPELIELLSILGENINDNTEK